MAHTYIAYIDESGDDGIGNYRTVGGRGGSSNWLVMSALVVRAINDLECVRWRDEIVAALLAKQQKQLHFVDLKHGQRLLSSRMLGQKPARLINIIAHKPSGPEGSFASKNKLYFYLNRFLMERISWLCRDHRPNAPEGNGQVKVIFSRRGGMSYPDFRQYLTHLKQNGSDDVRIHWPVIDIEGVDAKDHSRSAALQLADVGAAAFACGVEQDMYGNCEPRYAENLKPITYNRAGKHLSYGVKFLPKLEQLPDHRDMGRFLQIFR